MDERTNQASPLSRLCDGIRHSTTQYRSIRRELEELDSPIVERRLRRIDVVMLAIESSLADYCRETGERRE